MWSTEIPIDPSTRSQSALGRDDRAGAAQGPPLQGLRRDRRGGVYPRPSQRFAASDNATMRNGALKIAQPPSRINKCGNVYVAPLGNQYVAFFTPVWARFVRF